MQKSMHENASLKCYTIILRRAIYIFTNKSDYVRYVCKICMYDMYVRYLLQQTVP